MAFALINDPKLKVERYLNRTLLHVVCSVGNVTFAQELIFNEHEPDIYFQDDEQNYPLHVAALYGRENMVMTLINENN